MASAQSQFGLPWPPKDAKEFDRVVALTAQRIRSVKHNAVGGELGAVYETGAAINSVSKDFLEKREHWISRIADGNKDWPTYQNFYNYALTCVDNKIRQRARTLKFRIKGHEKVDLDVLLDIEQNSEISELAERITQERFDECFAEALGKLNPDHEAVIRALLQVESNESVDKDLFANLNITRENIRQIKTRFKKILIECLNR